MLVIAFVGVALAAYAPWNAGEAWLRWLAWPWVVVALVGSAEIWRFGNNAARVFVPAGILGVLALGVVEGQRRSLQNSD